jgi:hypothetical protein
MAFRGKQQTHCTVKSEARVCPRLPLSGQKNYVTREIISTAACARPCHAAVRLAPHSCVGMVHERAHGEHPHGHDGFTGEDGEYEILATMRPRLR